MSVRRATLQDLDAILALERSVPEVPHWPSEEYRRALACEQTNPWRGIFVWDSAAELLGFAVAAITNLPSDPIADLENVAVAPQARRRGVGRSLCAAAIKWCRQQNAVTIHLEVRQSNHAAIALYGAFGFRAAGTRKGYYREPHEDGLRMTLEANKMKASA